MATFKEPRQAHMDLADIVEGYGPIVAMAQKYGLCVTINASNLNLWVLCSDDRWEAEQDRPMTGRTLHKMSVLEAMELGQKWIKEITDVIDTNSGRKI